MTSFRVRPRFKQLSPLSSEQLAERFTKYLDNLPETSNIEGKVFTTHGLLRMKPKDQHFWSPQLQISFEDVDNGTLIRGMYGPHPTVWSIFMFGYAIIGLLFFFIGLFGLTRYSLGLSAQILWVLPILAILLVVLYVLSQTGQKVGAEQTFDLHHFYEETVGERVHIH